MIGLTMLAGAGAGILLAAAILDYLDKRSERRRT